MILMKKCLKTFFLEAIFGIFKATNGTVFLTFLIFERMENHLGAFTFLKDSHHEKAKCNSKNFWFNVDGACSYDNLRRSCE
jgi:hypothetical protein